MVILIQCESGRSASCWLSMHNCARAAGSLQLLAIQCNPVQSSAMQCNPVQSSAIQCNSVQTFAHCTLECNTQPTLQGATNFFKCIAFWYNPVQSREIQCNVLKYNLAPLLCIQRASHVFNAVQFYLQYSAALNAGPTLHWASNYYIADECKARQKVIHKVPWFSKKLSER